MNVNYEMNKNITFRRGLPSVDEATSGLFKLQKVRTGEKLIFL